MRNSFIFAAVFVSAQITMVGQGPVQTVVKLMPNLDTSIHSSGSNPRGDETILSGNRRNIGILDRGLLRFDFSAIPRNATIESASLRLQIVQSPIDAVFTPFELHRALKAWAADANWTSATAGLAWSEPGAEVGIDIDSAAVIGERVSGTNQYLFPSTNQLVADIRGWMIDPASNYGWMLVSANEGTQGTAMHFGSSESTVPPSLEIHYSIATQAPVLREVKLVSTNFTFEIHGSSGATYDVQMNVKVDSADWTTFTTVAGTVQSPAVVTVPATNSQHYFRAVQH